jgi:hypothetical protein
MEGSTPTTWLVQHRPSLGTRRVSRGFFDERADVWEMPLMGVQVVLQGELLI